MRYLGGMSTVAIPASNQRNRTFAAHGRNGVATISTRGTEGTWVQHRNRFHLSEGQKQKDTKYARVNHNPALVKEFCSWVAAQFELGVQDVPKDNPDIVS